MFHCDTPTRGKLQQVADKAIKVGQKDTKPAVIVTIAARLPNSALSMFDPALREILYSKAVPGEKARKQAQIEGIDEVSDRPALSATGAAIASIPWGKEQSGCVMTIDYGTGDERSNIVLKDGTAKGFKVALEEGGAINVRFQLHAPVDAMSAEQLGRLHLLHQRDVKFTLVGPKVEQSDIEDEDDVPAGGGSVVTPITALKQADARAKGEKVPA